MKPGTGARTVLVSCLALAVFSAVYSAAAWYDWWPRLPPGALHDTDLWAGFAGGVALLLVLLLDPDRRNGSKDEGSRHRAVGEGVCGGEPPHVASDDARYAPPTPTS
jgi:hypothetical protein